MSRRSKNEIAFAESCLHVWPDTITNVPMFNGWDADVVIPSLKVAVLWNGVWHYKKITKKHSVKQVQNRDRLKIQAIEECGYMPYQIEDLGQYDPVKVREEFEKFQESIKERT